MSEENNITSTENNEILNDTKTVTKKIKIGDVIFYSLIILIFIFTLFTTTIWFSSVKILQNSMLPTLEPNDVLILDNLSSYSRGDVIVFSHNENEDFIKRIIAVEGDTIYSIDGEIFIEYYENDQLITEKVNETYLKQQKSTYLEYDFGVGVADIPKTTISKDCLYVLGDNRLVSVDSRDFGEINVNQVKGVVHEFFIKNKGVTSAIFNFFENIFTSCKN